MEKLYELEPVVLPLEKPYELELVVSELPPPRWLFSSPSPDLEHGADEAVAVPVEVPQLPPPPCWLFSSPSPDLEHGADDADMGVLLVVCWAAVLASSPSS